jgi:GNAT superfamily N-acetyltransferase
MTIEQQTRAELHIRPGSRLDTPQIMELARVSLGEGRIPREEAYWSWKHHENPFGESPMLLAEADGELVGLRVFMRWAWRSGRETLSAVRAVDTATHPAWQGRGIFSRLTRALAQQVADEGAHLVFNTPNEKSRPGYLKMGWSSVGRTDVWIRPLRPGRMAGALLRRPGGGATGPVPEAAGFDEVEALCRQPELPALLEAVQAGADDRLSTQQSPAYLRWRYHAVPGFRYHALFEGSGSDMAAVVFRYKPQGALLELRICELLLGRSAGAQATAARLLRRLHRESGADYVAAMAAPRTAARAALLRTAYLPAPRLGPILTARSLRPVPTGVDLHSRHGWRLCIGDLELF